MMGEHQLEFATQVRIVLAAFVNKLRPVAVLKLDSRVK